MMKRYLFDSNLYYLFLHVILFFYIYSIQFSGVPFGLGTRVFLGIIGFFICLFDIYTRKSSLIIDKNFLKIFTPLFFIVLVSFLSLMYNRTLDTEFLVKYPISILIITFASYFVTKLVSFRRPGDNKFPPIVSIFINVVVIQIFVSLIMFAVPSFREFLSSIQISSDYELAKFEETLEFRLVGFGSKFFGAGIVNGFALIFIGFALRFSSEMKVNTFRYVIFFLLIFVFGMIMSRTTIIGALFALLIIFLANRSSNVNLKQIKNNIKVLFYFVMIPTVMVFGINFFLPEVKEGLIAAFNFGFEMFINYFQSNSLESESTNQMKEMYIWPTSLKTYIIGDGLYTDAINNSYYMQTDIGVLRLLYYFGIFGLFAYLFFQFQITRIAFSINQGYKYLVYVIFLYCIVLNYKGFTDLFFLNILFYFNNRYQDNINHEKNIISNSF
jgi:hypothetical protein